MYNLVVDINKTEQLKTKLTATQSKGDALLVNGTFGFLLEDGVANDERVLVTRAPIAEVHSLPAIWAAGEPVYDDGASGVNKTGTNRLVGYVYEDKDTSGTTPGTDANMIRIVFTGGN